MLTHGCNSKTATLHVIALADDEFMDPRIIFKRKNLKSSWLEKDTLKET